VINALLNLLFVIVFKMGVSGVGIATVISNIISSGMVVTFLLRADERVRLDVRSLRIHKTELLKILSIGLPAGLQGMVFSIANVCIQASINSFGSDAVAGAAIGANFEYISYYAVTGFNSAVMTFVSQNRGAGQPKRCKKAYLVGMACAVITCLILNISVFLARNFFVGIFTSEPEVAKYAVMRMRYVFLVHSLICSYEITGSALRGLGHSLLPALLTVFGTCVLRVAWVNTVVVSHHTYRTLMLVYPFSWVVTGTMVVTAGILIFRRTLHE
jgi:Na+-driven multidrug efflux pump